MVCYNFKKLQPVPAASDFVDIVLTRTQRKTPTVVHPGYKISRIRAFYMRKVKFTQQNYSERLRQILADFPRVEDVHPFYADLMNVLYDKDHYKLALGRVNTAKNLIETVSRDYVRLLKYGDSLYRCKALKRAALGRMCTVVKKLGPSLAYLEEVRKHLARLPSLDTDTRTLLVTGYPNVGKSSFMNKVTRANVEVQPYAFTTKSLYVGHMDYRYLRWQVIDTPGILDHPLEQRNIIEMQAITALAHLHCCVLYFIDISEQCGYTIQQQVSLFESIRPLFTNKQLLVVANKVDVLKYEELKPADRALIDDLGKSAGVEVMRMSNVSEEGVAQVKNAACDKLLQARVEAKLSGKRVDDVMNRLTVALPAPRNDGKERGASIPASVLAARAMEGTAGASKPKRRTEKDLMLENGGAGVYSQDVRKLYALKEEEWRWDAVPEIWEGKNVVDFVDPDIEARLAQLEAEEEAWEREHAGNGMEEEEWALEEEEQGLLEAVRAKKKVARQEHHLKKSKNSAILPRKHARAQERGTSKVRLHLESVGVPTDGITQRGQKRGRSVTRRGEEDGPASMEVDAGDEGGSMTRAVKRARSRSKGAGSRSVSRGPSKTPQAQGLRDERQVGKVTKLARDAQKKANRMARAGEADRATGPKLTKHLLAGKMSNGSRRSR